MSKRSNDPMLEMFIFETVQLLEQLEQVTLNSEKENTYSEDDINEIFRIMHTIKGSAAMMLYDSISHLAHSMEDIFFYIREVRPGFIDFTRLTDLVLKGGDFIKTELAEIEQGKETKADPQRFIEQNQLFLNELKERNSLPEEDCKKVQKPETVQDNKYYIASRGQRDISLGKLFRATLHFEEDCGMENVRAFLALHNIKDMVREICHFPEDITEGSEADETIKKEGFTMLFKTDETLEDIRESLQQTVFLKSLQLVELHDEEEIQHIINKRGRHDGGIAPGEPEKTKDLEYEDACLRTLNQSMISVNLIKLDALMDLVGELVISEAMVTQNPDIQGLELENFSKSARQLKKIIGELQDIVMSMRMVPLSATFQKMNRIVRDMCKKLEKDIELEVLGAQTEVDKNIIEHLSDPLVHIIRNAIDHGIETPSERAATKKDTTGKITLEAKNAGGNVFVIIKDDGRGLNRNRIIEKAIKNGFIEGSGEDLTDREVFSLIFLPGFSTSDNVTEFSGRGVGMDVVTESLEKIGGVATADSIAGEGTTITIRIPLTLAIIDGMSVRVGDAVYTIPITSIRESLRPEEKDVIKDPDGNEMLMIRGECYPVLRLHEFYHVETDVRSFHEGIIVMAEDDLNTICIFADELLGEQEVVVKALPKYTNKVRGIAGCTLLGNGSISLILDIAALANIG